MPRPLSFVRLDIARFGIEIADRPDDKTLADWVRKFHRSLALQRPEICEFASELLHECAEFRAKEAIRKRNPAESGGIRRKDAESGTDQNIAEQNRTEQKNKIKREKKIFSPPTLELLTEYTNEKGFDLDCPYWIDYWVQRDWKYKTGQKMVDWKAAVRTWVSNNAKYGKQESNNGNTKQYKSSGEKSLDNLKAIFGSIGHNKNPTNLILSRVDEADPVTGNNRITG